MRTLILELTSIVAFLILIRIMDRGDGDPAEDALAETPTPWLGQQYWESVTQQFGLPLANFCVTVVYALYLKLTLINVVIFLFKYVPTGFYAYRFMKDIYLPSRERIQQRRNEIEDIQLQIQIVNTKLSVRNTERTEQQRSSVERLRRMRARVRDVIAADDALSHWNNDHELQVEACSEEEEREIIVKLLKELKYDQSMDCAEKSSVKSQYSMHQEAEPSSPDNSFYTSLSDVDTLQECRVKIVKVTNVYKVAYLKQYIKLKRLRRATKQALLKKKMESIKKLLEDWQSKLNMVINSKLTILNIETHPMDVRSHEGMGDYSTAKGSSDSDSDLRNSCPDTSYDDYSLSWNQNSFGFYSYNYEDNPEPAHVRDYTEVQDYGDLTYPIQHCDRSSRSDNMVAIVEETSSQIAEEVQGNDNECFPDLISL